MARLALLGLAALLLAAWLLRALRSDDTTVETQESGLARHVGFERDGSLSELAPLDARLPLRVPVAEPVAEPVHGDGAAPEAQTLDLIVTDNEGAPVCTVELELYSATGQRYGDPHVSLASDDGRFEVPVASEGEWYLGPALEGERLLGVDRTPWGSTFVVPRAQPLELILLRSGTIRGTVIDGEGRPVAHTEISARLVTPSDASPDGDRYGATSDPFGAFLIEGAPATVGDERLLLTATEADGWCIAQRAITLDPGGRADAVVLTFATTRSVSGNVLDHAGNPLSNATVDLFPVDSAREYSLGIESDAQGRFEFPVLPAECFRIVVDYAYLFHSLGNEGSFAESHQCEDVTVLTVDCRRASQSGLTLRPTPLTGRRVAGRLVDGEVPAAFRPLIFVRASSELLSAQRFVDTDAAGLFEVLLAEGVHTVLTARPERDETVELGRIQVPTPGARIELRIPNGVIAGNVAQADGTPAAELELLAIRRDGALADSPVLEVGRRATTDAQGRFRFEGLEPGRWSIASQTLGEAPEAVRTVALELRADEQREDVRLDCVATAPLGIKLLGARPEPSVSLFVRSADGPMLAPFGLSGTFDLDRSLLLPAGRVQVMALQGDLASVWSREMDLQPGASPSIELRLGAAGSARVVCSRSGVDVPAAIRLYDARGEVSAIRSLPYATLMSAEHGAHRRRFGPLPPGAYRVVAEAADGRSVERSFALAAGEVLELALEF